MAEACVYGIMGGSQLPKLPKTQDPLSFAGLPPSGWSWQWAGTDRDFPATDRYTWKVNPFQKSFTFLTRCKTSKKTNKPTVEQGPMKQKTNHIEDTVELGVRHA